MVTLLLTLLMMAVMAAILSVNNEPSNMRMIEAGPGSGGNRTRKIVDVLMTKIATTWRAGATALTPLRRVVATAMTPGTGMTPAYAEA